jgi:hypothetical protein
MARPLRIEYPGTSCHVIHRGRCRRGAGTPPRRPGPRRGSRPPAPLGRFITRDPIEEAGGLNLYAFCGNDGVNRFDLLGMDGDTFDNLRRGDPVGGNGSSGGGTGNSDAESPTGKDRSPPGESKPDKSEPIFHLPPLIVRANTGDDGSFTVEDRIQRYQNELTMGQKRDDPNRADTPSFVPAPRDLLGTIDYYAWRNANMPESYKNDTGPNYLTEFAPKYFNKFVQLDKDWGGVFPGIHKWVNATKLELQLALEAQLRNNPALQDTRADLMRAAFRTHPDAYRRGFFGELTYLEKSIVALHLDRNDMMAAGWGTAVMTVIDSRDFFLPSERDFKVFGPFRKP